MKYADRMNAIFAVGIIISAHQAALGKPTIIAHRGASGYLPEHTLEAKALAYGQQADFIEQDVVLTKDGQPVILHDIHLDTVTNVAKKFPDRARKDGRYYAIDFSLAEIKQLTVTERFDVATSKPVFPGRFPLWRSQFSVPTLEEEIDLIQGLNASTGKNVGLYVELKEPAWHRTQGKDLTGVVLAILTRYGYPAKDKRVYLQCFSANTLLRLKNDLKTNIPLVQLIGKNSGKAEEPDFDAMRTPAGIKKVARYAAGIGPAIAHLYEGTTKGQRQFTDLAQLARAHNLLVHPYTARSDALPSGVNSLDELFIILFKDLRVDGVFTDFPDAAVAFVHKHFPSGAD